MGNNLVTLPGQTANHKFAWQLLVLCEAESVDFEQRIQASAEQASGDDHMEFWKELEVSGQQ